MFWVYAICSSQRNYIYVGMSSNIKDRIHRHNAGFERTTKPYKPFLLLYFEIWPTRPAARNREKFFKSGSGKEFLKNIRQQKYPLL